MTIAFAALTFVLTWSAWLASTQFDLPPLSGPGGLVFLLGVFGPAIVALGLSFYSRGRAGVRDLLRPISVWSINPWWYVAALLYMPVLKFSAAAGYRIWTGAWLPFGDVSPLLIAGAIAISTWVQAGEEIGWRGFLLPRLQARVGLRWASILVGGIWAVWHLPLFFIAGTDSTGQPFPLYTLYVTALSVAMAWAFWRTGSLFLVMFMHAAVNNTAGIVPVAVADARDPWTWNATVGGWITIAVAWAIAAVILVAMPVEGRRAG